MQINKYINIAFLKAQKCLHKNLDVPVAAVILDYNYKILAIEHNKCVELNNATFHAEILAINKAQQKLKTNKLNNCTLYTTLEPCLMCVGAIMHCRIKNIYFGAFDEKYGCLESNNILQKFSLPYKPNIYGGIMQNECQDLINIFFKKLRKNC